MPFVPKPLRVKSPCVDVCEMDEASGYCRGCRRTIDEIAGWSAYDDDRRRAVLSKLPGRDVSAAPVGD